MRARALTGALALACLASLAPVAAGGEAATDRYRDLLQRKRSLLREAALLKHEADWAASKNPYIFMNPVSGQMEFRVRGKTLKTYSFQGIYLDERLTRPALPEVIWRGLDKPITVLEKQGGRPELVPPDPEEGRHTGLLYSDPNQLAAQTGAKPVDTDAGVLGVDAPTEYFIRFEEEVIFHVRNPKTYTLREKASRGLSDLVGGLGRLVGGAWGSAPEQDGPKFRLTLYLALDPETAKHLHYSLLPGEKLIVVPPSPPPVTLVASRGESAGAGPAAR